jgi:septal ring factor EnvC (AmiA/AmiB activator)
MGMQTPLLLVLEMVIMMACLSWGTVSILRIGYRIASVQRRRSQLHHGRTELTQTTDSLRRDLRRQETELHQLEDAISVRNAQAVELQSQLNDLRRQGPREYTLMNERFGEKDRLWLLTVPRPDRPERWAVAAPDSGTALALLCARVTVPERPVVDDQLN